MALPPHADLHLDSEPDVSSIGEQDVNPLDQSFIGENPGENAGASDDASLISSIDGDLTQSLPGVLDASGSGLDNG